MSERERQRVVAFVGLLVLIICFGVYVLIDVTELTESDLWFVSTTSNFSKSTVTSIAAVTLTASIGWFFFEKLVADESRDLSHPAVEEIAVTEATIKKYGKKAKVDTEVFPLIFEEELNKTKVSAHIAIITMEALTHYKSERIGNAWKNADHSGRRRIVILLSDESYKERYDLEFPEVLSRFEAQGANILVRISDLEESEKYQKCIKDCAVFDPDEKHRKMTIFLSYLERDSYFRFSKSPNSFFQFQDEKYGERIMTAFDAIWSDETINQRSDALKRKYKLKETSKRN